MADATKPPSKLQSILTDLGVPWFKVTSRPSRTSEERDDPTKLYGVKTQSDLTRELATKIIKK